MIPTYEQASNHTPKPDRKITHPRIVWEMNRDDYDAAKMLATKYSYPTIQKMMRAILKDAIKNDK